MKLDLIRLNNYNHLDIDEDIEIPGFLLEGTGIRNTKNIHVNGEVMIDSYDEVLVNLDVTGILVLGCAITLDDVDYEFSTNIEENIGQFEDFLNKDKNFLDILPIIWENIVLEVPIRVVKEGVKDINLSGNGWELVSNKDE